MPELLTTSERFRVVVTLGQFDVVYTPQTFDRYEDAQSRVAAAVQHFGQDANVCAVKVQRGRPLPQLVDALGLGGDQEPDWGWRTERLWGPDVVDRIRRQQFGPRVATPLPTASSLPKPGMQASPEPATPPTAEFETPTAPAAAVPLAKNPAAACFAEPPMHKRHGWHIAAMAAFAAIAWIGLLALQTGGQIAPLLESNSVAETPPLTIPDNPQRPASTPIEVRSGDGDVALSRAAAR